ncbi:MAG: adenylate/guanylate cyclase domain-containing protein [Thermoanaerobaculia bacterium]
MLKRTSILRPASEDRLESLIAARLKPGADKEHIDQRIWDLFGENWCIMFTDLAGFSRHVARFGIIHFLQTIYESERVCVPVIEEHDGILLKAEGDSLLVIFRNVQKAILASIEMQRLLQIHNQDKEEEEKVLLCVGLGFGRVLRIGDSDVFGAEVNAASKLGEDTARAFEILVTEAVKEAATEVADISFEPISETPPGAGAAFRLLYD